MWMQLGLVPATEHHHFNAMKCEAPIPISPMTLAHRCFSFCTCLAGNVRVQVSLEERGIDASDFMALMRQLASECAWK